MILEVCHVTFFGGSNCPISKMKMNIIQGSVVGEVRLFREDVIKKDGKGWLIDFCFYVLFSFAQFEPCEGHPHLRLTSLYNVRIDCKLQLGNTK